MSRAGYDRNRLDRFLVARNRIVGPKVTGWTADEVEFEKVDSYLTGIQVGLAIGWVLGLVALVIS